jgi:integrase
VIALDDDTVHILKRHRERQDADREKWGPAWAETGMVFTQEDGSWLHPGRVTDLFERLVAASGLPPIRLHDLRHGAATLMLAAGVDVKVVSDTLGHSDTRITRDIYQSVLPQVGKSAAEATARLVPLQRKAEAEAAALEAARASKKVKSKAKSQAKAEKVGKTKKPRR